MSEPLQSEQTESSDTVSTETAEKQVKNTKTFSQEQLDAAVQNRLARAKKDFEAERASWESERSDLQSATSSMQDVIKSAVINVVTSRMSPVEKSMFEALPFEKQLDWVQKPENLAALNQKVTTPVTPAQAEKPKTLFRRNQSI